MAVLSAGLCIVPGNLGSIVTTTTVVLPGWRAGNVVYIWIASNNPITTPPAGWTNVIAEARWSTTAINTLQYHSLWKRTMQAGDTNPVFTYGSGTATDYIAFNMQSATIQTNVGFQNFTAGTTTPYGQFSPAHDWDARLHFYIDGTGTNTSPGLTVTPTDGNPSGTGFGQVITANINNPGATSVSMVIRQCVAPNDADSAPQTAANGGSRAFGANSIDFTTAAVDSVGDLTAPLQADPNIQADAIQGNLTDALNAAKGRFVGGARVL